MAALDMYNPMASRGYSMPPALGGYDLTPAQIHARETEPAEAMFTGADGRLYPAGHPMLTQQNAILFDNTDKTGGYTDEALAALFGPTANKISANRRDSTMMNQDPARYAPDGSSLVGDPYGTNENDVVFNSLVERYMSEGLPRDQAFTKAEERMAMGPLESLQENLSNAGTGALEFFGGIRDGGILSGSEFVAKAEERRDNTPTDLTPLGKYFFPNAEGSAVPVNEQQQNGPYFPEMPVAPPALAPAPQDNNNNGNGNGNGALTVKSSQSTQPAANRVRASTGGYTGNARGSGLPDMQIGLGERMMRMGMAGLSAGAQGPLAQMGAMTGAYNDVNQANRQAEMGTFKIEEERRQAHADRVAKLAAAKAKSGGDMDKLKDFQAKNFGFYNRGVEAEQALMDTAGMGTDLWEKLKSNVPLFGNALVDPKYQRYDQARRNFVNAVLRRESGAVISDAEFENANIQYFPQFGDAEETLSQKQRNRQTTMEGIRMGAGPSIFYTPAYPMGVPTDQGGGAPDQETEDLVKKYSQ